MLQRASTSVHRTATLLVVLWALQPLSALLHASDEHAHRFCPQHQTFEETVQGTGPGLSELGGERAPTLSSLPEAATDASRLTHETCPLLGSGSREGTPSSAAAPLALKHPAVSRPATAPPQPFPPLAILATAPKASPPALA